MFDKTVLALGGSNSKEYIPYAKSVTTTHHEHRAPTDDSVRLLNEMQEKAKDNLVEHIYLGENLFNARIDVIDIDYNHHREYRLSCELNGTEFKAVFKADAVDFRMRSKPIAEWLIEESKAFITNVILRELAVETIIPVQQRESYRENC